MFQTEAISDLENLTPSNAKSVLLEHFTEPCTDLHLVKQFWAHFGPKNFKILAENGQGVVKN